ncbi:hypothetical protein [Inquilinus sp. Marseille-Q2685]|uniref:hypothetical protein n=1 Tax=Inquilinus sp. Marseille-Q2685 TaxID=2866581 RepID=UPI001CE3E49E|nr:hypothetical protein [Inquilinus sp. Marseille-Q2685]
MPKVRPKLRHWLRNLTGAALESPDDGPGESSTAPGAESDEDYAGIVLDRLQAWQAEARAFVSLDISDLDLDRLPDEILLELQAAKLEGYEIQYARLKNMIEQGNGNEACTALFSARNALLDANALFQKISREASNAGSRSGWAGAQNPFVSKEMSALNLFEDYVSPIIERLEGRIGVLRERYRIIVDLVDRTTDDMDRSNMAVMKDKETLDRVRKAFNIAEQTFVGMKAMTDNLPDRGQLRRVFPMLADRYNTVHEAFNECDLREVASRIKQEINPDISLGI